MSPFSKLVLSILGISGILLLFTSIHPPAKTNTKSIDKQALIQYINQEVIYETLYGYKDAHLEEIVDKAMIKALKHNNQ